ncbi:B3 domain-containing protein REM9 [Sesamum alatum]|uniref:B3 domain-containing protein REM9 n=1 Tax=Sesamum alatum TaxID=300844 RepID=A0AAE2D0H3_9LAMI|nr:B3 domain-containing protein REM9 [Sesamum alatum]
MDYEYSFFKFILSCEEMQIPPAIVPQMRRALAQSVVLRDRYGNLWPMRVATTGANWYFRKDWPQFCEENSLQIGDFVIFNYKGDNLFDFILLGHDACEKKGVGALRVKEEEVHEHDNDDHYVQDDDDYVEEEESEEHDHDDDDDNDDDDYVEEAEEEYQVTSISKKIGAEPKSKSCRALEKISREDRTFGIGSIPSRRRYEKKNIPDCYGGDIFESGLAPRPTNPFFVTRSRLARRKNELYIPKDVITDYHLNIPEKVVLVDEQGRKWETKMKQWKDGRLWCTRGWRSLCNVNSIGLDDTCICEFVHKQGSKDVAHILVHALRI